MTSDQASPDKLVRALANSMLPFNAEKDGCIWDKLEDFARAADLNASDLNQSEASLRNIVRSIRFGCTVEDLYEENGGEASIGL
jgi:hypothetical protein